jgi:hypothetical protein
VTRRWRRFLLIRCVGLGLTLFAVLTFTFLLTFAARPTRLARSSAPRVRLSSWNRCGSDSGSTTPWGCSTPGT